MLIGRVLKEKFSGECDPAYFTDRKAFVARITLGIKGGVSVSFEPL